MTTTDKITPEAVKAARDAHMEGCESLSDMAWDISTAYLAQAEEMERLRKRVEAADRLSEAVGKMRIHPVGVLNEVAEADTAYRATEERG